VVCWCGEKYQFTPLLLSRSLLYSGNRYTVPGIQQDAIEKIEYDIGLVSYIREAGDMVSAIAWSCSRKL